MLMTYVGAMDGPLTLKLLLLFPLFPPVSIILYIFLLGNLVHFDGKKKEGTSDIGPMNYRPQHTHQTMGSFPKQPRLRRNGGTGGLELGATPTVLGLVCHPASWQRSKRAPPYGPSSLVRSPRNRKPGGLSRGGVVARLCLVKRWRGRSDPTRPVRRVQPS